MGAVRVRLGSVPMLASHCIVVAHHLLDRIVPQQYPDGVVASKLKDVRVHAPSQDGQAVGMNRGDDITCAAATVSMWRVCALGGALVAAAGLAAWALRRRAGTSEQTSK